MKIIALALIASLTFAMGGCRSETIPPKPDSAVSDYTNTLTPFERRVLEKKLATFEDKTQLVISIVKTLDGDDVASYANKMFKAWGIGKKGVDRGVLILIAKAEKKIRFEIGYGMEGTFTDAESKDLLNKMTPYLAQDKFYQALNIAVDDIAVRSKKE